MSKRKKLRTSGGEGVHPPKPPKNSRRGNADRAPQTSELDCLPHPESIEGKLAPTPSAELSGEDPAQAASSSPEEEGGAPPGLLGLPVPGPFPLSQKSFGKFVPQFTKPRKTVTRKAETREEDVGTRAFQPETPPEPEALQTGSQALDESPGLKIPETSKPGYGTGPEQRGQNPPGEPEPCRGEALPGASTAVLQESEPGPSVSLSAGQEHPSDAGDSSNGWPETGRGLAPGDGGQEGHLPSSKACGVPQEEGEGVPGAPAPALRPATQDPPDHVQTSSWTGGEADGGCRSSQRHSSPGLVVAADVNAEPTEPGQTAPEVAGPGGQANARPLASPSGKAPEEGHGDATPSRPPPTGESTGSRAEPGWEDEPPGHSPAGPVASLAPARGNQEPAVDATDSSPQAPGAGPGVHQKGGPGPSQEGPGGKDTQPLLAESTGAKAAKVGNESHEQNFDLERPSLSFWATCSPEHGEVGDSPDPHVGLAGRPDPAPDPADQASWGDCSAVELSFLLDSQIQEALDDPSLKVPPKQVHKALPSTPATRHPAATAAGRPLHVPPDAARPAGDHGRPQLRPQWSGTGDVSMSLEPSGMRTAACREPCLALSRLSPRWPGPSPPAHGDPEAQRPPRGTKACEASRMEDATGTVCGLIMELSNLNRLIMGAHRDLEACKRLGYRKAKPAGKAPAPRAPKGAAAPPREQAWRALEALEGPECKPGSLRLCTAAGVRAPPQQF